MQDSLKQLVEKVVFDHVRATMQNIDINAIAKNAIEGVLNGGPNVDAGDKKPHPNGVKRDPEVLAALVDKVFAYISANENCRMEQISAALGEETKDLVLPVKKLLKEARIGFRGQKRATEYFVTAAKGDKPKADKPKDKPKADPKDKPKPTKK